MDTCNICRFSMMQSSDLVCHQFILETTDRQKVAIVTTLHILGIVTNGQGIFYINKKAYELKKGDVFIACKDEEFRVEPLEALEYSYVTFNGRRSDELLERMGIFDNNRIFCGLDDDLTDFWTTCLSKSDKGNLDLFCESVLLYTLAHIDSAPSNAKSDVVTKIIAYTNDHYTDQYLSLAGMAIELGYDAKYLSHQFMKVRGVTFTAYLRTLRIKHAVYLFEQGMFSIKTVAMLSGFGDALYFSKVFKQETGLTPSEYISSVGKRHHE
ncbi:MAG: AraC family transcriptional regulator [Clostridiales bacterium]|nr:AraC family transcriptional regulator [Clostridiales bacterium]